MTATTQRRTRDSGQDKLQKALKTLEEGVQAITDSGEFRRYLTMMARFHHYSANNVMLILAHGPMPAMSLATRAGGSWVGRSSAASTALASSLP